MTTNNLLPVIELVEKIGADIPARQPTTPPASPDELFTMFAAIDDPLAARLREQLAVIRPDAGWAEHEFGQGDRVDGDQWVVDALDGAVQFIQGLPQWCVTVSLVHNGKAALTALHSPLLGQTYAAELGQGAWLNGKAIRPSAKVALDAAVVATSQPPFIGKQPGASAAAGRALPAVLDRVAAVRNLGPTSWQVADVANGRLDAFWEYGRDATNLLGAALVATEAGAVVTTADGSPWAVDSPSFLAASAALHPLVLELLRD